MVILHDILEKCHFVKLFGNDTNDHREKESEGERGHHMYISYKFWAVKEINEPPQVAAAAATIG